MKKLFVLAALLMATPSAHAGNSISFQIEGHKIRVHAPKNCSSLSCIQIIGAQPVRLQLRRLQVEKLQRR